MGTDSKLTLPPGTEARDVQLVMARAAGAQLQRVDINAREGTYFWKVDGKFEAGGVATCMRFSFPSPLLPWPQLEVLFHFEWWADRGRPGSPGLMLRSTAECIALLVRTGEFFGGELDANDCDTSPVDFLWPDRKQAGRPMSAADWTQRQVDIAAVQPITQADIDAVRRFAAYH